MPRIESLDLTKLLGFNSVSKEVSGGLCFQDQAFEAKLGAKVGAEVWVDCDLAAKSADATPVRKAD